LLEVEERFWEKIQLNNRQKSLKTERSGNRWLCIELPVMEYREAWNLQTSLVTARKDKIIGRDMILLLEHFPVFTLGHRGGLNNLKVSEDFLRGTGILVVHAERGGDITFHAPRHNISRARPACYLPYH